MVGQEDHGARLSEPPRALDRDAPETDDLVKDRRAARKLVEREEKKLVALLAAQPVIDV